MAETHSNLFHAVSDENEIEKLIDELDNPEDLIFLLSCFNEHCE
jgi:hypothetical protein